ncbi:MAG: 4-hydroxy-3-methylbut-2-enyl diphosphate reductase [archaeon]
MVERILLVEPRGFCAGVDRAITIVEHALHKYGKVYVRHHIVHNEHVVQNLEKKGAVFVEELQYIPDGSVVIFSAHGIAPQVEEEAQQRNLHVIDATCPLVKKVHVEARRYHQQGMDLVLIGHKGHPEVLGTMGYAPMHLVENSADVEALPLLNRPCYLTQTTLSVDETNDIVLALRKKYPVLTTVPLSDICYATQNRQQAVKELAKQAELIIVVGSPQSSNTKRLAEAAERAGSKAVRIFDRTTLRKEFLNSRVIGITSGASTPESDVIGVVEHIRSWYPQARTERVIRAEEHLQFSLPPL